jgi:glycosyltransferase involved in cell wall biosynthesis
MLKTKCFAVDTWRGDEHAGFYDDRVFDIVCAENSKYSSFSRLIRKTFSDALSEIENGSVDILHIDGRHFYDDVKEDFESWIPKLSTQAVVLFHDTEVRERGFGVWKYWAEVSKTRPSFNFIHQHGLGVLFWGSDAPRGLLPLLNLLTLPEGRQATLEFFALQGYSLAHERRAVQHDLETAQEIEKLSENLVASELQVKRQSQQLEETNKALANTEASLDVVKHALHESRLQMQAMQNDLKRRAHQLHEVRSRPLRNLARNYEFRALRMLSSNSSPLPQKVKSRFGRSANKRNPNLDLPEINDFASTAKNDTADALCARGQLTFRPDLPSVLIVTHDASRSGAPIVALNMAKHLSVRYNVVSVCLRQGELVADFLQVSTKVYVVEHAYRSGKHFARMLDEIAQQKIPAFALVNSIESRHILGELHERRIPCVALLHEFASYTLPKSAFTDAFYLADEVVFSSELTLENAIEHTSFVRTPRFHVLAQGRCKVPRPETEDALRRTECDLLTARLRPDSEKTGEFLVIGVGSVQFRKGVDLFIDVARRVLSTKEGQNARFAWIGAGYNPEHDAAYSVYLKDQIDRAGLIDRMIMLGETSEIEHVYALSNLLLLSSRLDPLPNVAIDALSEGLPVVCFDKTTGIADLLTDAGLREACVADYCDTEQAAEKVLRLIRSPDDYRKVSDTSKDFAKRAFDFGAYAARIEELGLRVEKVRSNRPEDVLTIAAAQDFEPEFMMPRQRKASTRMEAAEYYLADNWRESSPRRPEPGFNPLIYSCYLQSQGVTGVDPYLAFLQQGRPPGPWLRSVIRESANASLPEGTVPLKAALHIHAHYSDVVATIAHRLTLNKTQPDLFISAGDRTSLDAAVEMFREYPGRIAKARVVINRGRDIGPLLTGFGGELVRDYDLIGHVHTKKSVLISDREFADRWASFMFENMIGGRHGGAMIDRILVAFTLNERLGIVFPADPYIIAWSNNKDAARKPALRLGVERLPEFFDFPVGTMFWMRATALRPFVALDLDWQYYPREPVGMDGTVLHALERLFGIVAEGKGFDMAVTNVKGVTR